MIPFLLEPARALAIHYDWLLPFLQPLFFLLLLHNLLYLFLFGVSVYYFDSFHYHSTISLFNLTFFLHSLACPIPYFEFLNFQAAIFNSKKRMWHTPYKHMHYVIIHILCRYFRSTNWLINNLLCLPTMNNEQGTTCILL